MVDYEVSPIEVTSSQINEPEEPKAHLRSSGMIYFNKHAAAWFDGAEEVSFLEVHPEKETSFDPDELLLGLEFGDNGAGTRAVSRGKETDCVEVMAAVPLRELGFDPERIPEPIRLDPRFENGMVLVSLTEAKTHIWECSECERTFATERGRDVHEGREHKEE